ncbi:MAG: hypothetical protein WBA61_11440 [Aequorivita sp.]
MAKQTGPIRLKGTIGGINLYKHRTAGDLAREKGGGFSAEAYKNNKESMARPRENATEFGHCSQVKSRFRLSLAPFLCVRKDGLLHGRLMQLFTKIKTLDRVNIRGERKVAPGLESPLGRQLFENFVFTPRCGVLEVLGASVSFDFPSRTLSVSNLDIKNVRFPKGSTHLALTLGLLHFDFETLKYQLKCSVPFYIDREYNTTSFDMNVDLPDGGGVAMAVLGVKFYQQVEGTYYLFKSAKAVGLDILGLRYDL